MTEDEPNCSNPMESEIINVEPNSAEPEIEGPKISKRQLKRQKKWESNEEKWRIKKAKEKQRRKEKRKALKESGNGELLKKPKLYEMALSKCPIHVCIDMSYQEKMNEDLLKKTIRQLNFAYSVNRRAENPLQYHIANLSGFTKTIFDNYPGYTEWDVFTHEESISEVWPADDVCYLTSDSDNVLMDLDPKKVYIIGGLLDHNSHPGASLAKANAHKFSHARLPIGEFVKMQTRKVLTINQVFEIILRYSECNDWEQAFFTVIPKRKGMEKLDPNERVIPIEAPIQEPETQTIQIAEESQAASKELNELNTEVITVE